MSKLVFQQFSIIFFLIVLFEVITGSVPSLEPAHYIAKPAIVSSLLILFLKYSTDLAQNCRSYMIWALSFSLVGDILLMFVGKWEHFFVLGLIAFLIAHIFYILVFLRDRNKKISFIGPLVILIIYAAILFYLLKDSLGEMLFPVSIYIAVIIAMATTAFLRKNSTIKRSYLMVLIGALLFMISDSILALNKFYIPIPLSHMYIMATYAFAQYFIVMGILKNQSVTIPKV